MGSTTDTGHAVQATARLDHALLILVLTHLDEPHLSNAKAKELLATFYLRRTLAYELGLIDDATNADLTAINAVRAVFAHAEVPITFLSRPIAVEAEAFASWRPRSSVRRLFDEAVQRCERAIEERRQKIVYERSKA